MLSGEQQESLNNALAAAYPKYGDLDMMLTYRLEKPLPGLSPEDKMPQVLFNVIRAAEAGGWTEMLVVRAVEGQPGNVQLYALAQELGLTALPLRLQRTINEKAPYIDVAVIRDNLSWTEGQVCRIEIPTAEATTYGTGFLVGDDVVLTNYHVVESLVNGTVDPTRVTLRFDYKVLPRQQVTNQTVLNLGTPFSLANNWLVDKSPPDESDFRVTPPTSETDVEHLDYALLRLSIPAAKRPIGGKAEPGAKARGAIQLPSEQPPIGKQDIIFIVQHPAGEPLKLAFETRAENTFNGNKTRVRYATNTAGGSSGSPCFNKDWNLLALHHVGDPNFATLAHYNQGVPIARIRTRIVREGFGGVLA